MNGPREEWCSLYPGNSEGERGVRKRFAALLEFFAEVRQQMKEISFPAWREVRSTTVIVMVVVLAVAAYVYVVDQICVRLLDQMLFGGR
jgi:preprotein translocase SecE subunit